MSFLSPLFPAFHHTRLLNDKLSVIFGVYAKCSFVPILKQECEGFNIFLSIAVCKKHSKMDGDVYIIICLFAIDQENWLF